MVSKTVLVAFVAVCCAQAFVSAAPYDEEITSLSAHKLGGYLKCLQDLTKSVSIFKDVTTVIDEYKNIFAKSKEAIAACAADKDGNPIDETAVKKCKSEIQSKEISDIISETTNLGAKFAKDWPVIQDIISECF